MQIYTFVCEKSNVLEIGQDIHLKKGLNIRMIGEAEQVYSNVEDANIYELKPTDFHQLTPKLLVKIGDKVKIGSPIFHDKYNKEINFCSPVSGEIKDIIRGAKRRILKVVIVSNDSSESVHFPIIKDMNRESIIQAMCLSGLWPCIRQKPYDTIANPKDVPKSIFISSFNSAPNAIDNDFALYGKEDLFQAGLDIVSKLTDNVTHLNIDGYSNPSKVFTNAKNVQINRFYGHHPAGNVGIQVHHLDPINKGEVVWYVEPQHILAIATLFREGRYDPSKIIAVTGSQVKKPKYYRTIQGTSIKNFLKDNLQNGESRIISGNVLTGERIDIDGSLGFYNFQITAIPEGNVSEFLGWLSPGLSKFSASRTFLSWLFPNKK